MNGQCRMQNAECRMPAPTDRLGGKAVAFNLQSAICILQSPPRRSRRAFTLIEILATLALVAIILPVAMSALALADNSAGLCRDRSEAAALAQTKLAELLAEGQLQNTTLAGDFAPEHPEFRWTAVIADWQMTSLVQQVTVQQSSATLQQVNVDVTWTRRGTERTVGVATLIYSGTAQ
jgi:prepilin-type N-terminal cleavage/methylation domain-containing protein